MKHVVAALLWVVLSGTLMAQESAETASPAEPEQEDAEKSQAAEPAASSPEPAASAKSPESFRPSEEISEDLSVSFPVDI